MLQYVVAALILLVIAVLVWDLLKKLASKAAGGLINSVAGLLILVFLNKFLGWSIPIGLPSIIVCGLFGIPGVGSLIILHYFHWI